jgi:protein TilB
VLAAATAQEKKEKQEEEKGEGEGVGEIDDTEMTIHDPETRRKIYLEIAAQKKEKAERQKALEPRERDYEQEQATRVAAVKGKEEAKGEEEEEKEIRQCNEGKWEFVLRDDDDEEEAEGGKASTPFYPGCVTLDLALPRHLDSSLVDVDVHPCHINVVIKGKLLRLKLPAEVSVCVYI